MEPAKRVETLLRFASRVTQTPEVRDVLRSFDMEMIPTLTRLSGRVLKVEEVSMKSIKYASGEADWTQGDLQFNSGFDQGCLINNVIQTWFLTRPLLFSCCMYLF